MRLPWPWVFAVFMIVALEPGLLGGILGVGLVFWLVSALIMFIAREV